MVMVDVAARRGNAIIAQIGMIVCLLCGLGAITLRGLEFSAMQVRWDTNAYGSIVWFMLGMHALHLLTLTCETLLLFIWSLYYSFDMKHRVDVISLAVYWYWVAAIWIVLYGIIYFAPRLT